MKKQELLWWSLSLFGLLALYFFTRLIAIRALPPFNDEFIYVRWAQEGFFDPDKRLLSLTDGKQPLYIWLVTALMNAIASPMAAGRIVSIFAGAGTVVGLVVLGWRLFKNKAIALLSGALYIVYPLALLLDRFALYDSLLATFYVWSMLLMLLLVRAPALGTSLVLALVLGAALLTKSSALLFLVVLPIAVIFFERKAKDRLQVLGYFFLATLIAFLYQSVELLSAESSFIGHKNQTFVYTLQELRNLPVVSHLLVNMYTYGGWLLTYLTIPLFLSAAGILFYDGRSRRTCLYLAVSFVVPFLIVSLLGKLIYTRHFFFITMPLLPLAAAGVVGVWNRMKRPWLRMAAMMMFFLPAFYLHGRMLLDYKNTPLPAIDRFQYIDGWPAGWGVKEITRYLEAESANGELTILTEGVFGSLPTTAMRLYFGNYPQVHIVPLDDQKQFVPPDAVDWTKPVFLITNIVQALPARFVGEEILRIQKGTGDSYMRLYRLSAVGGR